MNLRDRLRAWLFGCEMQLFDDFWIVKPGVFERMGNWWDSHSGRVTTTLTAVFALAVALIGFFMADLGGYIIGGVFTAMFVGTCYVLALYWDRL